MRKELEDRLNELPRVELANLPTPLQKLDRLSDHLGGPEIYIKRDDLTGIAFGGNKTRMMEYRIPPILEKDADVVVTGFGLQSNHARQITVAARKFGLDVHLILRDTSEGSEIQPQGNLLIDLLAGARVDVVQTTFERQEEMIRERAEEYRKEGRTPYVTGFDDENLSAVSYVGCGLELHHQLQEREIDPDYIVLASEGATQAGLLLFSRAMDADWEIVGLNPVDWLEDVRRRISGIAGQAAETLGLDIEVPPSAITNTARYLGSAYGVPTAEALEAIKLVANTEGFLLDPVYTGKAMAGLIDMIEEGRFKADEEIVFVHTGGFPALFCVNEQFDFSEQLQVQA
ncbi:MAG: D-cysteine desulfhydrase family protein [Candidatus Bipolaricaulota bacterium]